LGLEYNILKLPVVYIIALLGCLAQFSPQLSYQYKLHYLPEELSDIEDNESFAMPRFNKEDEHVDIGELRKDLIAAAKKESDDCGGKKNPFLTRVSTLLGPDSD